MKRVFFALTIILVLFVRNDVFAVDFDNAISFNVGGEYQFDLYLDETTFEFDIYTECDLYISVEYNIVDTSNYIELFSSDDELIGYDVREYETMRYIGVKNIKPGFNIPSR